MVFFDKAFLLFNYKRDQDINCQQFQFMQNLKLTRMLQQNYITIPERYYIKHKHVYQVASQVDKGQNYLTIYICERFSVLVNPPPPSRKKNQQKEKQIKNKQTNKRIQAKIVIAIYLLI